MFIECIQRHIAVCAQMDLPKIAMRDPNFWNLISIREPARPAIHKQGFKKVHTLICYDVTGIEGLDMKDTLGIPRKEHPRAVFRFADQIAGEPLLIHCWAGISRSTAVALALIAREMHTDGFELEEIRVQAPDILLAIRRQAAPNPLILELGLAEFLPDEQARQLAIDWVNHPVLFANRMGGEPD
jgi:predicted protein tyrosine phosphatase